ncbi:unnamed protein product, partial [Callosobruchus maculatus]
SIATSLIASIISSGEKCQHRAVKGQGIIPIFTPYACDSHNTQLITNKIRRAKVPFPGFPHSSLWLVF